jgi:hypothetical protein
MILLKVGPVEIHQDIQYKNYSGNYFNCFENSFCVRVKRDLHGENKGSVQQTDGDQRVPNNPEPTVVEE